MMSVTSPARLRTLAYAITIVIGFLAPMPAVAQTAPGMDQTTAESPATTKDASVSRSAKKATTYKIGTAAINLGVLSFALGNVVDGGILSGITAVTSWMVYTGNDYLWDTFYPAPAKQTTDQAFNASEEAWRSTLKWFTYKPAAMAQKFAILYAYTGSVSMMLTWGVGISAVNTVWYFANDLGWNWYDWYTEPALPEPPKQQPAMVSAR